MRAAVIFVVGLVLATAAHAEDATVPPKRAPHPRDINLLDEFPNYAEVLSDQWHAGVPTDVTAAAASDDAYGRLLDTEPVEALSLSDCIALTLQNNTDLQIQKLGPASAATQVQRAWSVFDPRFYSEMSRNRLVTPSVTFLTAGTNTSLFTDNLVGNIGLRKQLVSGGQLSLDWRNTRLRTNPSIAYPLVPQYTTTLGFSLVQPLLRDFGWDYSRLQVRIAQTTEEAAYRQYEAAIANIVAEVERRYWVLAATLENVRVQEQGLELARELLRQNEGKYNVGSLPQTAVLEAKAEVARRESDVIRATNAAMVSRDALRAIINYREAGAEALLNVTPSDKPVVIHTPVDLASSLDTGLHHRPELQAARLDVHGNGLQRKVAENQLLPRLSLIGQLGVNGLSGTNSNVVFGTPPAPVPVNPILGNSYGDALGLLYDGRFYNYAAGAQLEIPIDNAQAKADYAKANINFEQSRLSLRKVEETVTLEIKTAVSNLQSDLKNVEATRIARELAQQNVRNQQARYDVGLATTKDLIDYQDRLTQAQFSELQALTKYATDLAEWRRAEGTLLPARNIVIDRMGSEPTPWWASF
jgi:outer membrane protein